MELDGYLLKFTQYHDFSGYLTAYTSEGLISIFAKDLLKREEYQKYLASPLTLFKIHVSLSKMNTYSLLALEEMVPLDFNMNALSDLNLINFLKNALVTLTNEIDPDFFAVLKDFLMLFNRIDPLLQKCYFLIILCRYQGYNFVVDECIRCHSHQNINNYNIYDGGLLCLNCVGIKDRPHSIEVVKLFRALNRATTENLDRILPSKENLTIIYDDLKGMIKESFNVLLDD
ncbi:MAG: DNA repair protein RecO C-terminal domain-containing protein [Erysipelotrichaceae bacterium]|jgi:DNA repair protein RecO (recombination protein O)|nr:DNA repair protein RecO C-terminal domain-containing protein [Erysipelotrichaceae bacterium]